MTDKTIVFWAHMLDEAFCKDQLLTEGKHWPEDYTFGIEDESIISVKGDN